MDKDQCALADGLIAYAIAYAGMGEPEASFRSAARNLTTSSGVVRLAADRIQLFAPEPMRVSKAERHDKMIKLVGGQTVIEELEQLLQAREWLCALADVLET